MSQTLVVKTVTRREYQFVVDGKETIRNLKEKLEELIGMPFSHFDILHGTRCLQDDLLCSEAIPIQKSYLRVKIHP